MSRAALLTTCILTTLVVSLWCTSADAQLVIINRRYKVIAIDTARSLIHVSPADHEAAAADVIVTPQTRMYQFDRPLSSFSWKLLHKGSLITVHGGSTWDARVKAKKIYL